MMKFLRQVSRGVLKVFLSVFSTFVIFVLVMSIMLHAFVLWLNTDSGGTWANRQANIILQDSGYTVVLKGFVVSGAGGVHIASIDVFDDDRAFMSIANLSAHTSLVQAMVGRFDVSVDVVAVHMRHLPKNKKLSKQQPEKTLLVLPPFLHVAEFNMRIHDVHVSDDIVPQGFKTSVTINQHYNRMGNMAHIVGDIMFEKTASYYKDFFPYHIQSNVIVDTSSQSMSVDKIHVKSGMYDVDLSGTYGFDHGGMNVKWSGAFQTDGFIPKWVSPLIHFFGSADGGVSNFSGTSRFALEHDLEDRGTIERGSIEFDFSRMDNVFKLFNVDAHHLPGGVDMRGALDFDIDHMLIDGGIDVHLPKLSVFANFVDGRDLSGAADAKFSLSSGQGMQGAKLNVSAHNAYVQGVSIADMQADVIMPNVKEVESARGHISLKGVRSSSMHIDVAAVQVRNDGESAIVDLNVDGRDRQPFKIYGRANVLISRLYDVSIAHLTFESAHGRMTLSGQTRGQNLDFEISGGDFAISDMPFFDLALFPVLLDNVSGYVQGTFQLPIWALSADIYPQNPNERDVTIKSHVAFADQYLDVHVGGFGKRENVLDGLVRLPLSLSLAPFNVKFITDSSVEGRVNMRTHLKDFPSSFVDFPLDIGGILDASASINGVIDAPEIKGVFQIQDAFFSDAASNVAMRNIQIQGDFDQNALRIHTLNAQDEEELGTLSATAVVDVSHPVMPQVQANIEMNNMHITQGEQYNASLNADIELNTLQDHYIARGRIVPKNIVIHLPDQFEKRIPFLDVVDISADQERRVDFFDKIRLDMVFEADNQIFVRGQGLDTELKGTLDITGKASEPLINGNLKSLRGRYKGFGRTFDLDHAVLRFQGRVPPSPYLDVAVSTDINNIRAMINITDRVTNPKIGFSATPSLPKDEVLSLILFGEDIEKISPFQAVQLANTLRRLSGQSGGADFDPLAHLQQLTGIDDLRVDGVGSDNATVGAGKYVTENVYLEVEQGTVQGSGAAAVTIDVTPSVSIESKTSQSGDTGFGVFWEREY